MRLADLGAPCPIYATSDTWALIDRFPIRDRGAMSVGRSIIIDHLRFKAFPVEHSRRALGVGLRICAGESCLVYVPDVGETPDRPRPLRRIELYIGDVATVRRPMVRRKNGALIGHAPIAAQLDWCAEAGVRRPSSRIAAPRSCGACAETDAIVRHLGVERGIDAQIAVDASGCRLARRRFPRGTAGTRRHRAADKGREKKLERIATGRGGQGPVTNAAAPCVQCFAVARPASSA